MGMGEEQHVFSRSLFLSASRSVRGPLKLSLSHTPMSAKFEVTLELQGSLALLCDRSSTSLMLDTPQDVFGLRVAAARQLDVTAHLGGLQVRQRSQLLASDTMLRSSATLQLSLELSEGEKALLNRLVSKSCALVEASEALAKQKAGHELQLAEEVAKRSRLQALVDGKASEALALQKAHELQLAGEVHKRSRLQARLESEALETKRLRTAVESDRGCGTRLAKAEEAVTLGRLTWRPFGCVGRQETGLSLGDPVARLLWQRALLSLRKHREHGSSTFREAPKLVLKKVTFLHNSSFWGHYRLKLQELQRSGGCSAFGPEVLRPADDLPGCGQAFLFHGTPWENVQEIKETNLRRSCHPENMFGRGIYFAQNLSKADLYTGHRRDLKSGSRFVFVCRVALGREFRQSKDDPDMSRPPAGFDSVLGLTKNEKDGKNVFGQLDHPEHVVYDSNAVNPEYLLEYMHEDACRCHNCLRK